MFALIIYRYVIILSCCLTSSTWSQEQGEIFEILPSQKIVIDNGDDLTVTCIYNVDCDALVHQEDYPRPIVTYKRSNNTINQLTWKVKSFGQNHKGTYICKLKNCLQSPNDDERKFEIEVKDSSLPKIQLLGDGLKKVPSVNVTTSFRLNLTGSPMPQMRCMHNGEQLIFCSSENMKKVIYHNPSCPCNSSYRDPHYEIRSEEVQTSIVVFHIINVTFASDNVSTVYCNWKNDDGDKDNIPMQIVVTGSSTDKAIIHSTDHSTNQVTEGDSSTDKPIIHSTDHSTSQVTEGDPYTDKPIITTIHRYSTKQATNGDNDNTTTGIIIGCVLLLLIFVMVGTVLYCRERKLKNTYKTHLHSSGLVNPNKPLNEQMHELIYDKDWEFPFKLLGLYTTCLGEGNFGKIVIGKAYNIELLDPRNKSQQAKIKRNQLWKSSKKRDIKTSATVSSTYVAIKTVKDGAPLEETRNLIGELKLMMHIGEHEHIVNLLGVTYKGYKLRGILEYCPHGDLRKFLWQKRSSYQQTWVKTNHNEDKSFTLADQVTIAKQVAEGMQFLSSKKCVHRDLAARNILLAEDYVVKIADFGIARKVAEDYTYKMHQRNVKLPFKWMAIESLFTHAFTQMSDVWSFGILLWEIMTLGDVPYYDMAYDEMKTFLNTGKRLEKPDNCTDELYGIMLDCWKRLPECRHSFKDIHETLRSLLVMNLPALDFEENMNVSDLPPMEEINGDQHEDSPGNSYITIAQVRGRLSTDCQDVA